MLLDPKGSLVIRWRYLPRLLPWLWRFLRESSARRTEANARAQMRLLDHVGDAYRELVRAAGADDMLRYKGLLFVYRGAADAEDAAWEMDMFRRHGVRVDAVERRRTAPDGAGAQPGLHPRIPSAGLLLYRRSETPDRAARRSICKNGRRLPEGRSNRDRDGRSGAKSPAHDLRDHPGRTSCSRRRRLLEAVRKGTGRFGSARIGARLSSDAAGRNRADQRPGAGRQAAFRRDAHVGRPAPRRHGRAGEHRRRAELRTRRDDAAPGTGYAAGRSRARRPGPGWATGR